MESVKTRALCAKLQGVGAKTYVIAGGNEFQQAGLPDRIVAHVRYAGFFEAKERMAKLSALQSIVIRDMLVRTMKVVVVRYFGDQVQVWDDEEYFGTAEKPLDILDVMNECAIYSIEKHRKISQNDHS